MGLALVRKYVESVGTRIWLESSKGRGCGFCFTWREHKNRMENRNDYQRDARDYSDRNFAG